MVGDDDIETLGLGLTWNALRPGRKFRTVGRTVTEADITAFVNATGMVEVLFTNIEHLERESLFSGRRLAPAALVYGIAEGLLIQAALQGTGMAFLGMEMTIENPCFAGDTIHVECEVLESRATSKAGRGFVRSSNRVLNQEGAVVLTYTPARLVKGAETGT